LSKDETGDTPPQAGPAVSLGRPLHTRRAPGRLVAGTAFLLLGVWTAVAFGLNAAGVARARRLAASYSLDQRRPAEFSTLGLQQVAEGPGLVLADAALADALVGPPAGLEPEALRQWTAAASGLNAELANARGLVLDALTTRPGAAQYGFLLGEIVYVEQRRVEEGTPDAWRWVRPLQLAGTSAPGLTPAWTFLAGACLEQWPRLAARQREVADQALAFAFHDPGFIERSFLAATSAVGMPQALKLLPDESKPLHAALQSLAGSGAIAQAALLLPRLERSSRSERAAALSRIEERRSLGDLDGVRAAGATWLNDFPPENFDDATGRAQTARLLKAWPNDIPGAWRRDPRGTMVRFFLEHREREAPGDALLRATEALTAVPEIESARVHLLAGDVAGAEAIAKRSRTGWSYDWAPYLVELARERLRGGRPAAAKDALDRLSASARESCEVVVLRQALAGAGGSEEEARSVAASLKWLDRSAIPPEAWSAEGSTSLCIARTDPAARMTVELSAAQPAILRYGWNGGWWGRVVAGAGPQSFTTPLPPGTGRQRFTVEAEFGGPIRLGKASVSPGG
jgi:hypothetical protein